MHSTPINEESDNQPRSRMTTWLKSWSFLPGLVLIFSLIITHHLWQTEQEESAERLRDDFDFRVRESCERIEQRLFSYEQVLRGAQGLFTSSDNVGRNTFRTYVAMQHLEDNYSGIQGVGFSLIVPPAQKNKHTAVIRKETLKEGIPVYTIKPEGKRNFYTSIIYLEPFSGRNLRAFGYDMFSEPVRRKAMELARDSGKASISGKVTLVQEAGKNVQAGFLMYLPVYKNGTPHDNVAERRANILGWVYEPFRMNDLIHGIFGERADELDNEIYDGEEVSDKTLMYDSDNSIGSTRYSTFNASRRIDIAGHFWTVLIGSYPIFDERLDTHRANLIAKNGISLSLLLTLLTWLLVNGRSHAFAFARKMNLDLIQSERVLHESEEKLQAVLNASQIAVGWASDDGRIEYVNPKFIELFGYTINEVPTIEQWFLHAYPDLASRTKAVDEWNAKVRHSLPGRTPIEPMEMEVVCNDGSIRHVILMGSWAGIKLLANFSDITERKQTESKINYLAYHDQLTELPNRELFYDRLSHTISLARRKHEHLALMFLDLDGFKAVNDSFGHEAGDKVLKAVALRLLACVRSVDTVARMGGDEFTIILSEVEKAADVASIAEKIIQKLSEPVSLNNIDRCQIGVSIGIAIYPENGYELDKLMSAADRAMYESKAGGKNTYTFFKDVSDKQADNQSWIVLDAAHLLGIPKIDQQHQELTNRINRLNDAVKHNMSSEDTVYLFDDFISYARSHFEAEERLMDQYIYIDAPVHKQAHSRLIGEADYLRRQFIKGGELLVLQFLKDWLLPHIIGLDKSFASFLIQHGASQ